MNSSFDWLVWAVRALAQPADIQKTLFPSFVVVADELALTFDEYYKPAVSQLSSQWSSDQVLRLRLLDEHLSEMSGSGKEGLWLADDCLSRPEWSQVRLLAKEAILAFGWPSEQPPPSEGVYIPGKKDT